MRFVRAKEGDVKDIVACRRKSLEKVNIGTYSEKAVKELLTYHTEKEVLQDLEDYDVFCYKKRGVLVGTVYINGNRIEGLHIHPLFVGRGYGFRLLRRAERKIRLAKYKYTEVFSTIASERFFLNNKYVSLDVFVSLTKNPMKFIYMVKKIN